MGKREKPGAFSRFREWLKSIPHLFAKVMVSWCILCGTAASFYALRIMSRTDNDPAALLGVILGFFGGELLFLVLRTIFNEKKQ